MNYIWVGLIILSLIIGAINGVLQDVVLVMLTSAKKAVEVSLGLTGVMAFWLGIMKIADKAGIVQTFAKLISPITKHLFKDVPPDSPAISDVALNFSANALGLANSATPFGIKAMEDFKKEEEKKNSFWDKKTATNSMCLLLAMNTAGFQLIPISVITILISFNAKNPTEIIIPVLIVTTTAFISAIIIAKILERFFK